MMDNLIFTKIFYQFFVHAPQFRLSYNKIKEIKQNLADRSKGAIGYDALDIYFSLLLWIGLVDRIILGDKVFFILTKSLKIKGRYRTIFINGPKNDCDEVIKGVNYIVQDNTELINDEIGGLFSAVAMLKAFPDIVEILKNRFAGLATIHMSFIYLKIWTISENCQWIEIEDFQSRNSIYKVYLFNVNYYRYCFVYNGAYYDVCPGDKVTLDLIKNYLLIANGKILFEYFEEVRVLKEYFTLIEPIRKVLYSHHILETGKLPENHCYFVDNNILLQLKRIYS